MREHDDRRFLEPKLACGKNAAVARDQNAVVSNKLDRIDPADVKARVIRPTLTYWGQVVALVLVAVVASMDFPSPSAGTRSGRRC